MKKKLLTLSPKTRKTILTTLYFLIFAVMVYKIVTAHSIYEMVLFAIPAIYCVYATFGETARARYHQVQEYVHSLCEPAAALRYMDQYPSIQKNKRYASAMRLLRAYALMDAGQYEEAVQYITVQEKEAFSTAAAKPIAAYLLFTIAFLKKNKREVAAAFAALTENKSVFVLDAAQGALSHTWQMCEGNYDIMMEKYEEAKALYESVDLSLLKTNRERGYYYYSLALICKGLGDKDAAAEAVEKLRHYAPGLKIANSL